jgi:dTDP-4-amino-4,6-dideoxygalactose transaminase
MIVNYLSRKKINKGLISKYMADTIRTNMFTNNGPSKYKLEERLHNILHIDDDKRVVCVNNGTSALMCLMYHYKKKAGRKLNWVSPSFTFPSVITNENNVDLIDIDINTKTLPMDIDLIKKYDGVIITNVFGTTSQIEEWEKVCRDAGVILIFDNASSPLSSVGDKNVCNFGDASFGSLHHTKYIGFGEGGFVIIPKEDYDDILGISNFGFCGDNISSPLSSNFKMSEVSAIYILQHLDNININTFITTQDKFVNQLKLIDGIELFNYTTDVVYGNIPILFEKPIDVGVFSRLGIEVNKYYKPLNPNHENSNNIYSRIINLPIHEEIGNYEIEYITKMIKKYYEQI